MLHSWSGKDEDLGRVLQSFGLALSSYARVGRSLTAARSFRCGEVVVFDLPFVRWNPTRLKLGGRVYEGPSDSAFAFGSVANVSNAITSGKSKPSAQVKNAEDCPYCAFETSVLSAAKLKNIPLFMASAACALWPLILSNDNVNSMNRAEHVQYQCRCCYCCCTDHHEVFCLLHVADTDNSRDSNNVGKAKAVNNTFSNKGDAETPPLEVFDETESEKDHKGVADSKNKLLKTGVSEDGISDNKRGGLYESYPRASYHLGAMHVPSLPISPSMKHLTSFCDWFVEQWFAKFTCGCGATTKDSFSLSLIHAIMAAKVNSHRAGGNNVDNDSATKMKEAGADNGRGTDNESLRSNVLENVAKRERADGVERNSEAPIQSKQSRSNSGSGLGCSDGRIADGDWCLLPIGSKLAHSCSPNLFYSPPPPLSAASSRSAVSTSWSSVFRFIAIRDIEEGEVLSFSYVGGPLLVEGSAVDRQQRLINSHMFTCVCERCRGWDYTRTVACPNCTSTDSGEEEGTGLLVRRTSPLLETPFDAYPSEAPLWQCRRRRFRTATDRPERRSAGDESRSEGNAKREEKEINRVVSVMESEGCGYFSYCGVDDENESLGLGENQKEGEDSKCGRDIVDEQRGEAKKGDTCGENAVRAVEHEVAAQFALSAAAAERGKEKEEGSGSIFLSPSSSMNKDTVKLAAPKPLRYQSLIPLLTRAESTLGLGNWATQRTIRGISVYFKLMIATASSSSLLLASRAMLPYLAWSIRYLAVVELFSGETTSTNRRGGHRLLQKGRVGLEGERILLSHAPIPMRSPPFVRCWPRWVPAELEKNRGEEERLRGPAAAELSAKQQQQQLRQSAYPHMVPTRFILSMIEVLYKDLKPLLMLTAMGRLTSLVPSRQQLPSATAFKIALLPMLLKAVLPMAKVAAGIYDDGTHTGTCTEKAEDKMPDSSSIPSSSSIKPFLSMEKLLMSLAGMGPRGNNPQHNKPPRRTVFDWVAFGMDFHHTYHPNNSCYCYRRRLSPSEENNGIVANNEDTLRSTCGSNSNSNSNSNTCGGGGVYGDDTFIGAILFLIEAIRCECITTTTTTVDDDDEDTNDRTRIINATVSTSDGPIIKGSGGVEDDFVFLDAIKGCLASDGGMHVQSKKGRTRRAEKGEGHDDNTCTHTHQTYGTSLLCDLWI